MQNDSDMDRIDLEQMLDEVELKGTKIDLGEVIREGTRYRRRRRLTEIAGGSAVAAIVVAAIAVPLALHATSQAATATPAASGHTPKTVATSTAPGASGTCKATSLALPKGMKNYETSAIDPSGRYVVGWASSNVIYGGMFWDNGKPTVMHVPGKPEFDDVNTQGVVVGSTFAHGFQGGENVYTWKNGSTTLLRYPMAGKWHPYETFINSRGDVVTTAEPRGSSGGGGAVVVVWRAGQVTGVKLPLKIGSADTGIADDQLIAADIPAGKRKSIGVVVDYTGKVLHKLSAGLMTNQVSPTGNLVLVQHAGLGVKGGPGGQVSSWNMQTGALTTLNPGISGGWAINAHNTVLDGANTVWAGKNSYRLAKVGANDHWSTGLGSISDTGVVVGQLYNGKGVSIPTEWHC